MEALERENNAREALGMNGEGAMDENDDDDDNDDDDEENEREQVDGGEMERNAQGGGDEGGSGSSSSGAAASCGEDGQDQAAALLDAAVRNRLAGVKRAVEIKVRERGGTGGVGSATTANTHSWHFPFPMKCQTPFVLDGAAANRNFSTPLAGVRPPPRPNLALSHPASVYPSVPPVPPLICP